MLGLQTFTKPSFLDTQVKLPTGSGIISCDFHRKKIFTVISKISGRNQAMQISSDTSSTTTMEIDKELDAFSSHLQPTSWSPIGPSQTHRMKDALSN